MREQIIALLDLWVTVSDYLIWIDTWCSRWLYWDYGLMY